MCVCNKGTHLIMGAVMLNGVACGMVYRPLKVTPRKRADEIDNETPAPEDCSKFQPTGLDNKPCVGATSFSL